MNFETLKAEIKKVTPGRKFLPSPILPVMGENHFSIISSLYYSEIYCNHVTSVDDIYNIVNISGIDKNLFDYPFYIEVSIHYLDENTVNVINQLSKDVFVQIEVFLDVDAKTVEFLSKINHDACRFKFNYLCSSAAMLMFNKFHVDEVILFIVDEINSNTIDIIKFFCSRFNNPRFTFKIKDISSLQNLYAILPYIPQDELQINIDDNIFNEKNSNNARNLLFQDQIGQKPQDKKLHINYNGVEYEDIESIYELERYLEVIKSHIPSHASGLDIVSYISLFITNYFKYDYDIAKNVINGKYDSNFDEDHIVQFISLGKGVCNHFARFTKYLLNSLGIECEIVDAYHVYEEYNNKRLGHSFNVVKLEGKWYFLDNTWLLGEIQRKVIKSLAESEDFLTSNDDFGHKDFAEVLSNYSCETYDREEIKASVERVLNWNKNYTIHLGALKDLFRKHILKKEKSIEEKLEDAIPGRR